MLLKSILVYILCVQTLMSPMLWAANLDLPPNERPQVRNRILECQTMLVPAGQVDDSVGIPFSSNSPTQFGEELQKDIAVYGLEKFRGGTFYVMGVAMQNESTTRATFQKVLEDLKLDSVDAKILVMSAPSRLVGDESVSLARHILQRVRYFFPSLRRDLQTPQWGEIMSDWQATLAIESVNVVFLFKSMPPAQAGLVVATHAVFLNAYTIFTKSMLNFLFRNGSRDGKVNNVELFMKQMLLSMPFVLNYNVFGHFSEILKFYSQMGWQKTVEHFPYEMAHFTETQGLTLVLQTIFYSQIVTKGFGSWVDGQVGDQNTRDARTLRPLLQIPVLATDAVLLMFASSNWSQPLLHLGAFDFNAGHAGLIGLTATMWLFFKKFPKALDPILHHYQARKARQLAARQAKVTPPETVTAPRVE